MAQFNVGINASIMGAAQLARFKQQVQALGLAVNDLGDELHDVNGQQVREFRVGVQATTAAQRAAVRALVDHINTHSRFGATVQDSGNAAEQAARHFRQQQQAIAAATRAANNHAAALARLQQRQALVTQAQQVRLNQSTAARDANRQADSAEFDRRRNARLQDEQDRYNRQMQAAQQRHAMAMQRINAYGGAGPGSNIVANLGGHAIGKVLAYDALRRTLTNIYQLMGKIGDEVRDWVVESVKFNDEMKRAEIVFTGLGLLGLKNSKGESMSISEAENSKDPKVANALAQSQKFGQDMVDKALKVAVLTGQDTNEMVAAARQLSTDLMNKKSNVLGPGKNAVLDNPAELAKVTEEMLMIGAALKMADPGGRKLGFHMVAVQELFSGTNGGKKDTGLANVRSMMMREGIKIREADALPIAQAVNKGELNKAAELIKVVMEKAGMSGTSAKNLQEGTLMPNVDGVKTMAMVITGKFTQGLTDSLIKNFYTWRMVLANVLDNKKFLAVLNTSGKKFAQAFDYVLNGVSDGLGKLIDNPEKMGVALDAISKNLGDTIKVMFDFGIGIGKFVAGFMGLADGKTLDISSIQKFAKQVNELGIEAGQKARDTFQVILDALTPITINVVPGMVAMADAIDRIVAGFTAFESTYKVFQFIIDVISILIGALGKFFLFLRAAIATIPGMGNVIDKDRTVEDWQALDTFSGDAQQRAWAWMMGDDIPKVINARKAESFRIGQATKAAATADEVQSRTGSSAWDPSNSVALISNAAAMNAKMPAQTVMNPRSAYSLWAYGRPRVEAPSLEQLTGKKPAVSATKIESVNPGPMIAKHIENGLTKKPMVIRPDTIRSDTNIHIGTISLSAENLQSMIDQLLAAAKGNQKLKPTTNNADNWSGYSAGRGGAKGLPN